MLLQMPPSGGASSPPCEHWEPPRPSSLAKTSAWAHSLSSRTALGDLEAARHQRRPHRARHLPSQRRLFPLIQAHCPWSCPHRSPCSGAALCPWPALPSSTWLPHPNSPPGTPAPATVSFTQDPAKVTSCPHSFPDGLWGPPPVHPAAPQPSSIPCTGVLTTPPPCDPHAGPNGASAKPALISLFAAFLFPVAECSPHPHSPSRAGSPSHHLLKAQPRGFCAGDVLPSFLHLPGRAGHPLCAGASGGFG